MLAVRVALGVRLAWPHGADKLGDLTPGPSEMLGGIGIPAPAPMAPLVAFDGA